MDISTLLNCYCKSREMMHYYSTMLQSDDIGDKEKDIIYDLLLDSVNASNKIKSLCERRYEHCECEAPLKNKNPLQ